MVFEIFESIINVEIIINNNVQKIQIKYSEETNENRIEKLTMLKTKYKFKIKTHKQKYKDNYLIIYRCSILEENMKKNLKNISISGFFHQIFESFLLFQKFPLVLG